MFKKKKKVLRQKQRSPDRVPLKLFADNRFYPPLPPENNFSHSKMSKRLEAMGYTPDNFSEAGSLAQLLGIAVKTLLQPLFFFLIRN